jgi:3-oxoacyl-[acyl-carrier-protein] synthase-3
MLKRARLIGVGGFKAPVLTNDDFIAALGRPARVVDRGQRGGSKSRFCAFDLKTGRATMSNTDMAEAASRAALKMAGLGPDDIDLVIYSSATPDYPLPPSFTLLQERLRAKRWMGFDIRSGCAGFGTAIVAATQFLATGMATRALIVGADLMSSRYTPFFAGGAPDIPLEALFNMMLFGDAAGAIILDGLGSEQSGIFGTIMGSDRAHLPFGSVLPIGGSLYPFPTSDVPREDWPIKQDGPLTKEAIPAVAADAIERFLHENGLKLSDFACVVMPVVNELMRDQLVERLPDMTDDRVVSIGPEGGALINAAVPLSIEKALREERIRPGDRVLIYSAENTRWHHAVIGMTWQPS